MTAASKSANPAGKTASTAVDATGADNLAGPDDRGLILLRIPKNLLLTKKISFIVYGRLIYSGTSERVSMK
jgi:hypothetical protein